MILMTMFKYSSSINLDFDLLASSAKEQNV